MPLVLKFLKILLFVLAGVLFVRTFAFTSCTIPSSGMENSLYQGERVIVNKWSYGLRTPFTGWFSYHCWLEKPVERGDVVLFNNPMPKNQTQDIDRRALYISRCVGIPGDTLMLDSEMRLTSRTVFSPDSKSLYTYASELEDTLQQAMERLGIEGNELVGYNGEGFVRSFSHYEMYLLRQELDKTVRFVPFESAEHDTVHPFVVPRKGEKIRVYPWNIKLLYNTLVCHENRQAEVKNDTLWLDGKPVRECSFGQDYYWMASNNSVNLSDSRLFGLVPRSHLVGRAALVWFSKDNGGGLFGGYRWNRFFQLVK